MESVASYLKSNFLTESEFLEHSECSHVEFSRWKEKNIFPNASYLTNMDCKVNSSLGEFDFNHIERWYPKGLREWVQQIKYAGEDLSALKTLFFDRYKIKINELRLAGLRDPIYDNEWDFNALLEDEWRHFLNGTYGICTKDCSPEQIATKDLTIRIIDRVTDKQNKKIISGDDIEILIISVNLLDAVSSLFAPHERERSSRKRCIELVRKKYIN